MDEVDRLFQNQGSNRSDFTFDSSVATVFDDMVSRSVPFYHELQRCLAELARAFAVPHSTIYDLGCSTGTTLKLPAEAIPNPTVRLVGYDNSKPMLEQASIKLADHLQRIELRPGNIEEDGILLADASVVMMNWTLQFVRPIHRDG
jgi:tRNA (cmo5U34)-methyltransferase